MVRLYLPSSSVTDEEVKRFLMERTVTPASGLPSASVTVPEMVVSAERSGNNRININKSRMRITATFSPFPHIMMSSYGHFFFRQSVNRNRGISIAIFINDFPERRRYLSRSSWIPILIV